MVMFFDRLRFVVFPLKITAFWRSLCVGPTKFGAEGAGVEPAKPRSEVSGL